MTRIAHLSDPHLGTVPDGLSGLLAGCLADLKPDVVVVSGDLTQRALRGQYREARDFLMKLPGQVVVFPGNHDAPLWNLPLRLFDPWRNWRQVLALPLEARAVCGDVAVVGINSANPKVWKDGLITSAQLAGLEAAFGGAGRRILALHHPPEPPAGETPSLAGAARLVEVCERLGVEMVLSGHLHFTQVAPLTAAKGILAVQAGTCLSSRTRDDGNAFTLIDLKQGGAGIAHYRLATDGAFRPDAVTDWMRGADGWH